jgi:hypothetical protein
VLQLLQRLLQRLLGREHSRELKASQRVAAVQRDGSLLYSTGQGTTSTVRWLKLLHVLRGHTIQANAQRPDERPDKRARSPRTLSWRPASSRRPILCSADPQQQRSTLLAGLMRHASSKWPRASPYFSCFTSTWPRP